jgi:putative membrane protein
MNPHPHPEQGGSGLPTPERVLRGILGSRAAYGGLSVGVLLFAAVIVSQGMGDVMVALRRAGWGIVAVALLHLPQVWADAMGWRGLVPEGQQPPRRTIIWARWIGESINDLLPVLQMGGNVVKAWLLANRGVRAGLAGASVVVDLTLVVLTQILFTLLGVSLLVPSLGGGRALPVVLVGAGIMTALLAGFYVVQRRGFFGLAVRMSRRILGGSEWASLSDGATTMDADVLRLYADRRSLMTSGSWHMLAWFVGIAEVWFALFLLGHPVNVRTALLFESLGQAIRTGAFAVPGALGIQEGGYVLVGSALGIEPGVALGLSLVRRVRELLLGIPGLASWQAATIGRRFRKNAVSAGTDGPGQSAQLSPRRKEIS